MKEAFFRITVILILVAAVIYGLKWNKPPKIVVEKEIKWREKAEPIISTSIEKNPAVVFLGEKEVISGNTRFIFTETKQDSNSIPINKYKATVKTDSSRADLDIYTDGKLYDVQGIITYNQKETITTVTRYENASGLFLSGQSNLNFNDIGVSLDYVFKNKIIVGTSLNYDIKHNNPSLQFKLGFKL